MGISSYLKILESLCYNQLTSLKYLKFFDDKVQQSTHISFCLCIAKLIGNHEKSFP